MRTERRERLKPASAYRLWAPSYADENAVSALEDRIVGSVMPDVDGCRLLDVGCGTGRRIVPLAERLALAVGVDLVPEMLLAGKQPGARVLRAAADVRSLPLRPGAFDLLWCRLVLGHVEDLCVAYGELARVARPGADLIVSDFHADAVAAGHTRTFRDQAGTLREVEHYAYSPADHASAAASCGWAVTAFVEAPAGRPERPFYERAGRLEQFEAEAGLPLVMVMCCRR